MKYKSSPFEEKTQSKCSDLSDETAEERKRLQNEMLHHFLLFIFIDVYMRIIIIKKKNSMV
jgi:predicted nucleic acid-binding Zn ribbon protein